MKGGGRNGVPGFRYNYGGDLKKTYIFFIKTI